MASSSSRPRAEPEEYIPNLSSYETDPAKASAGPHHSDLANKLDPRVDSDLNNRAQYAPGTTMTTNVHPGATAHAANPQAQNTLGPHKSDLMNRVDPRVDSKTGETTTKTTTNSEGSGPRREPVNSGSGSHEGNPGHMHSSTAASTGTTTGTTGGGVVGGSSTGAPAVPSPVSSPRSYNREQSSYNSATGMGYTPAHHQQQPASTSAAASGSGESKNVESAGGAGGAGSAIKGVMAGIHGMGESIRGKFNAGVDRQFNEPEGVAKNEAIGREGEYEAQTGEFAPSTKQREGLNMKDRT